MAPGYLSTLCRPVSVVPPCRCHLRSVGLCELDWTIWPYTEDGHLLTLVIHLGTLYNLRNINLTLSTFFFSSSQHILLSEFEVSDKNALYKSTVIIIARLMFTAFLFRLPILQSINFWLFLWRKLRKITLTWATSLLSYRWLPGNPYLAALRYMIARTLYTRTLNI